MNKEAPKQENAIDSSKKEVLERGGNFNKTPAKIAEERAELIAKDAEGQKEDATKIEELSKKMGVDLSKSVEEKISKAEELNQKIDLTTAEKRQAYIDSQESDYEKTVKEVDAMPEEKPDLTTAEGRQKEIDKTESDYEKTVREVDATPDKKPDLTTAEGRQAFIDSQESDYEKVVKEVDSIPETLEEKNQKIIDATESDYERVVREVDSIPETLEEKNQKIINATESDYERVVREVDAMPKEAPKETPEASGKGSKEWDRIQSEALDDFVKGLKSPESPAKKKMKRAWGWIKERLKGMATLGYAEVRQAERFRSGTKEEVKNLQEDMKGIDANTKRTANLSEADAYEEAGRMQELAKEDGKKWESKSISKEDLEKFSEITTQEKVASNSAYIETIIAGSTARLAKRLEKYKNEFGESVLTEEKIAAFQDKIRDKLQLMQKATVENNPHAVAFGANTEELKKNIRESFDPKYWKRYVYGGAELVLGAVALKYAVAKIMAEGASTVIAPTGFEGVPAGPTGMENIPMDQNVWTTAKQYMAKNLGINNPSNSEIYKLTHAMCGDNGIGVELWNQVGSPMDTAMQQGHPLKLGEAAKSAIEALLKARGGV